MGLTAQLIGNRKWTEDANGSITSLTRRYQIIRDGIPSGTAAEEVTSASVKDLPQKQAAHSAAHPDLKVSGYSWEEGAENRKRVLYCDVAYSIWATEWNAANKPPRGQAVEAIGWRSGTVSRDLVRDAGTGALLVNTAGQPFDSVPQVDVPAPTFTKVVKTSSRQGWAAYLGKINAGSLTVGGISCGAHCLRCVQCDEERLWGDEFGFKYRYTIGLQLMSNKAVVAGGNSAEEIGWDLAVVSCGTYARPLQDADAAPVSSLDAETGNIVYASSPVLLDADGMAMLEPGATPYAIRVQAYEAANFPGDFTSEPA